MCAHMCVLEEGVGRVGFMECSSEQEVCFDVPSFTIACVWVEQWHSAIVRKLRS